MQQEFTERSQHLSQKTSPPVPAQPSQDGFHHHDLAASSRPQPALSSQSISPASSCHSSRAGRQLDQLHSHPDCQHETCILSSSCASVAAVSGHARPMAAAGKRISDYENAMGSSSPKRPLGFKVAKPPAGVPISLPELPDELWELVMSKLDPRTHHAIALVSHRFHRLASTQRTWKMAFMNHFPGQKGLTASSDKDENQVAWYDESAPGKPSVRFFARLSLTGSWREEYALRTSLLRSMSKGKSESDFHACSAKHKDKTQRFPTLTYWPRLSGSVTHLDAAFSDDPDKPPRAIHGSAASAESSMAVPLTGKILSPPVVQMANYHSWSHYMPPHTLPYGLGNGLVFVPNVMEVSHRFGCVSFSSFPGGTGSYVSTSKDVLWLGYSNNTAETAPQVSRRDDCVTAAWMAKSNAIYTFTGGNIGILTGSAMGFISGYSFQSTAAQPLVEQHFQSHTESVSWAVSPGVPIIAIKVDETYSQKRGTSGRAWAVALNALGEVFTLADMPDFRLTCSDGPWEAGLSACWQIIPSTRRQARLEDLVMASQAEEQEIAAQRTFSPAPSSSYDNRSKQELESQSRKIDEFCQRPPSYFRQICLGWDMRRRLEVDFAAGDDTQSLEHVFVITCGHAVKECPPGIFRYTKRLARHVSDNAIGIHNESIFGPPVTTDHPCIDTNTMPAGDSAATDAISEAEWLVDTLSLDKYKHDIITASALDMSNLAVLTISEESLDPTLVTSNLLPGRRGRWLAVGTDSGALVVWNGRCAHSRVSDSIQPTRLIQTDSPEITCLSVTALYVVHGGSDGRLQAWDPLGSTLDCVRVLNAKQKGSLLRPTNAQQMLANHRPAVRAIYLDPNPTKLRGLASYGRVVRCWSYSATNHVPSRKRRHRFVDTHGRYVGRRQSNMVAGYIGAEQDEIEREIRALESDRKYLRDRFTLADLTEEEAILYAQTLSEEAAEQDMLRRATDQDTSTSDSISVNETDSDAHSIFVSNEPGVGTLVGIANTPNQQEIPPWTMDNSLPRDAESDTSTRDIELAIRLSLQEVDYQEGESSRVEASPFTINVEPLTPNGDDEVSAALATISQEEDVELRMALLASLEESRRSSRIGGKSNQDSTPRTPPQAAPLHSEDEDLQIALELSRHDEDVNTKAFRGPVFDEQHFPDLRAGSPGEKGDGKGKPGSAGKGKKGKWVKWSP